VTASAREPSLGFLHADRLCSALTLPASRFSTQICRHSRRSAIKRPRLSQPREPRLVPFLSSSFPLPSPRSLFAELLPHSRLPASPTACSPSSLTISTGLCQTHLPLLQAHHPRRPLMRSGKSKSLQPARRSHERGHDSPLSEQEVSETVRQDEWMQCGELRAFGLGASSGETELADGLSCA
jgi:hypothetical protein